MNQGGYQSHPRMFNRSLPFKLPDEKEATSSISGTMAGDLDHSAPKSNNAIVDGISNLLRYVETLLEMAGKENKNESESHAEFQDAGQN